VELYHWNALSVIVSILYSYLASYCEYNITGNTFKSNTARERGGCIYYNKFKPLEYMNNIFDLNNYAPYGKEVGGYPVGVKVISYDKLQLSSG
jgi:hypothetical protein